MSTADDLVDTVTLERAALSAMLESSWHCRQAANRLTRHDFDDPSRADIYDHILEVWRDAGHMDGHAVALALLDRVQDPPELVEIRTHYAAAQWIDTYVDELRRRNRHARIRQLASALSEDPDRVDGVVERLSAQQPEGAADLLVTGNDLADELADAYEGNVRQAWASGWRAVDEQMRLAPGLLHVVTGRPSDGKSTWLDALLVRLSERHNLRHLVWSPENHPYGVYHVPRIVQRRLGMPVLPQRRGVQASLAAVDGRATLEQVMAEHAWVCEHWTWITPRARTIDEILSAADAQMRARPVDTLVIDPHTELTWARDWPSERDHHQHVLTQLQRWGREHGVAVVLVAHPQKPPQGVRQRKPTGYDISGSAMFVNKADIGVTVWREPGEHTVEVIVWKVRHRELGQPGSKPLEFDPQSYRFTEPSPV